jgi:hypothetical protein
MGKIKSGKEAKKGAPKAGAMPPVKKGAKKGGKC